MFKLILFCLIATTPLCAAKIAVIGGGLSGLTCAYRLKSKGYDVDLYEARNRVGGRVFSVYVDGHPAELGGQNILDGGEAVNLFRLIEEFELETEEKKTKIALRYFEKGVFTNSEAIVKSYHFDPVKLKSDLETIAAKSKNMKEVLTAFLGEHSILNKLATTLLSSYEGAPPVKLSPYYVGTLYHFLLGGVSAVHQYEGGEEPVFEHTWIKGGNAQLAERLALTLKEHLHLKYVLKSVQKDSQGYILAFENGEHVHCDILVLTIPPPTYSDIDFSQTIPQGQLSAIRSLELGTNAKIIVPVSSEKEGGAMTNGRFIAFTNVGDTVLNMYYIASFGRLTQKSLKETYFKDLEMVKTNYKVTSSTLPIKAQDKQFASYDGPVFHSWPLDPFAKGSYSYVPAGKEDIFLAEEKYEGEVVKTLFKPVDKTLFFAGEHTSTLPDVGGTMEAAVFSGEQVARLISKK